MVGDVTLRSEVAARLRADGFVGKGGTYRRDEGGGFFSIVDVGPLSKRPDISPHIGMRYEPLERLHGQLRDLPDSPNAESYGANVGYVVHGDFRAWSPPTTSDEVLDAIRDGFNVLSGYMSLELIPVALERVPAAIANPSARYRMVLVPFMLRREEQVRAALDQARIEYCRHEDTICEKFRRFESRILEAMNTWDSSG